VGDARILSDGARLWLAGPGDDGVLATFLVPNLQE
jgi:hypothetical protein